MAGIQSLTRPIPPPTDQRKNTMNLKSILGLKASPVVSREAESIAARISTVAGCQALSEELTQQLQALTGPSPRGSSLRRKLEEIVRIQKGHEIAEDRQRAAAVIKRDMDAANKALKAAEARLKAARQTAIQAGRVLAERSALIDGLNRQLAAVHAAADSAVEAARGGFDAAVIAGDQVAESAAFDELKKARQHRATCGESLNARIKAHEGERERLERESAAADRDACEALDALNQAHHHLARIEYDQAAQLVIDAYAKWLSVPKADSAGRLFPGSTIHKMDLTVSNPDRVAWGSRLVGESGRVRDYVLADMAKVLPPADLDLLAEELPPPKEVEPPLDLPNPFKFMGGSLERSADEADLSRAIAGMSADERETVRNRLKVQAYESRQATNYQPLQR